jgi:hypothetical protein
VAAFNGGSGCRHERAGSCPTGTPRRVRPRVGAVRPARGAGLRWPFRRALA